MKDAELIEQARKWRESTATKINYSGYTVILSDCQREGKTFRSRDLFAFLGFLGVFTKK